MTYLRNYARAERQGPPGAHRRRRPGAAVRRRRLLDARLARSAEGRRARPVGRATSCARSARRTCRPRPASSARRRACPASTCSSRSTRRAACRPRRSSATSSSRPGADGEVTRLRDVARIELGASRVRAALAARQQAGGRRSPIFQAPGSNAIAISDNVRTTMAELKKNMPEGVDYEIVYDPTAVRARLDRGGGAHAARGRARWSCWW